MLPFRYQPLPLDSKTIRVLELHPGRKSDEIRCSLQHCPFPPDETTSYESLSYCWGGGENTIPIKLDGYRIEVTKNLHAALVRLRSENEIRRLWIDAICINQNDDVEKAQQVQMMRQIYQHGSKTLVWLGPASWAIDRGFSLVPKLLRAAEAHRENNPLESQDDVELPLGYNTPNPRLTQFLSLFELPHFTRVWVVQEVAVSSSIEILCGRHSISWDQLIDAAYMSFTFGTDHFNDMRSLTLFWNISEARSRFRENITHNLLRILIGHRGTSATCAKDKVYALLGLVDPRELQTYRIVPSYRDDYSVEEAYIDTAKSILATTGNLDLFSVSTSGETSLTLPTWVPDWSQPPRAYSFIFYTEVPIYTATGSSTSKPFLPDDSKGLGLFGYIFDEVTSIGYATPDRPAPLVPRDRYMLLHLFSTNTQYWIVESKNLRAWKNWLSVTRARSRETYITGEPMLDAFWKTFMGRCASELEGNLATFRKECEYVVGYSTGPSGFLDCSATWTVYCIASAVFKTLWKPAITSLASIQRTFGRRMFTTSQTYIGLGPKRMRSGDCLALLEGGQVPYILRRKGQEYELIGECYVHGIMEGERFDKSRCEQIWLV